MKVVIGITLITLIAMAIFYEKVFSVFCSYISCIINDIAVFYDVFDFSHWQ